MYNIFFQFSTKFSIFVSTNTQSGDEGADGAPTKDEGDLTDEGEASRDKDTNPK